MRSTTTSTIKRRDFLRVSALTSGGMLIGINFFSSCKPDAAPAVDISLLNFKDFNAYLRIAEDGYVTIFSPNPEIGQGVKTAMPMILAEELDVEWGKVIVEQGKLNTKDFDRQTAGGSQSIRQSWDTLRQTGATARQMLINAAAEKWGVDPATCTTSKGYILNAKGEKLDYGSVATEAAALEVPENVALKDPKDFTIIGTSAVNVDLDKIVTGKPLFGLDYKRDNMVYASVLRPPAFGQTLIKFDDTAAKAVNGVQQVLQFGDKIAVLASNTWAAFKGKNALQATWSDPADLESTEDHNRILTEILDGNRFDTRRDDGDIDKAFTEADQVLERTYHSPFLPHNCMEPMNFFAHVTEKGVELAGPIQTPESTARRVADLLGRDAADVSVEMTRQGGGFGRRLYSDIPLEAAEISDKSGLPVKVVYTREDDMSAGIYRPSVKYRIKASIKDGTVTGYHLKEAAINGNMYGLIPNFFPAAAIPNFRVSTANFQSKITTGAWRAPYTNFLGFAEQAFFDELAELLGKDPVELRIDLLEQAKNNLDDRIQYSPERMIETIRLVAEKGNWGKPPKGVFQGFAAYYSHNTYVAEVAEVMSKNGKPVVTKIIAAVDCGIVVNPTGARNQVQGGVLDGLGHAMYGDLRFINGKPQSNNFNTYRLIRIQETPQVEVHFVPSEESPTGLGEPGLPPAAAAVANAIKASTGQRVYDIPFFNSLQDIKTPS
ncbi:MAG: xanthine dehydrogenase family protein molybdopterin-binding subunit [Bacteroidetes bacterium]|nr:MAG: xanthine dehydrogenase family protein molybdopterin-binding subunit [Bacteroidota bacterium]